MSRKLLRQLIELQLLDSKLLPLSQLSSFFVLQGNVFEEGNLSPLKLDFFQAVPLLNAQRAQHLHYEMLPDLSAAIENIILNYVLQEIS